MSHNVRIICNDATISRCTGHKRAKRKASWFDSLSGAEYFRLLRGHPSSKDVQLQSNHADDVAGFFCPRHLTSHDEPLILATGVLDVS